ncbi:MAG: NAD(P)-binding protein [Pseudobdellovibrionaceae bacterium]
MAQLIYDYIIVGSGLSGLIVASELSKKTSAKIAVLEAQDHFGGIHHNKTNEPLGLRFFPNSNEGQQAMAFLQEATELSLLESPAHLPPVTFINGEIRPFLGFGESSPEFYEQIQYFLQPEQLLLKTSIYKCCELLFQNLRSDFFAKSYVTKFHHIDSKVTHVTVNGSKTLYSENFIFTGNIRDLGLLLPEDKISLRQKNKLLKGPYWSAVQLDLTHSVSFSDDTTKAIHLLNGTTEDDLGPCVGRIASEKSSQWLSFVDQESSEDPEVIGAVLKKIKRQIKRAYPVTMDHLVAEKISIYPHYAGDLDGKLISESGLISGLDNLWVVSPLLKKPHNIPGTLLQAQVVLENFLPRSQAYDTSIAL